MPAGAPKGNKNAEKWTYEKSEELLLKAIELSNLKDKFKVYGQDKEIEGYKYDFIGEVARELDTFHTNITREIPKHHPSLLQLVNKLKYNLEANCYANTKKGIIKEATGIVNLKSNHKWTDRVDQSSQDGTMTPKTIKVTYKGNG